MQNIFQSCSKLLAIILNSYKSVSGQRILNGYPDISNVYVLKCAKYTYMQSPIMHHYNVIITYLNYEVLN